MNNCPERCLQDLASKACPTCSLTCWVIWPHSNCSKKPRPVRGRLRTPRGCSEAADQGLTPVAPGPGLGPPSEVRLSWSMTHTLLKTNKVMELLSLSKPVGSVGPRGLSSATVIFGGNTPTPPTAADCLLHKKLPIPRQGAGHYKTV